MSLLNRVKLIFVVCAST